LSLVLTACGGTTERQPTRAEDLPSGRYLIVTVPGTQEMIQLDTANGNTWRLTWSVGEEGPPYATGWESLDATSRN
jgi:hypothetical protein